MGSAEQLTAAPRVDADRVRATLGDPELGWLVDRLGRWVRQGRPLTGVVRLSAATAAQHRAAGRLLGRTGRGASLSVPLDELEDELIDAGVAPDLQTAIEVLTGPLADLAAGRADDAARRDAMEHAMSLGRHAGQDWYDTWRAALATDGTLTRLIGRGEEHLAGQAASVLGRLPADGLPLPVLAERVTGDTKALSGTPLAHLVLRALAQRAGVAVPAGAGQRRALWEGAGVVQDDLASQVLVLGLTGRENNLVAGWLGDAADCGIPFRLTLHMLTADAVTPAAGTVFVCENPAVLRVAASDLAQRCAALICTEGEPSAACHRLLAAASGAGARIRWRGDLDWTGIRTTNAAIARYGAQPWRMSVADYRDALALGDSEPLRGSPVDSGWDGGALSRELAAAGRAVMEERLIPQLIGDLAAAPLTRSRRPR